MKLLKTLLFMMGMTGALCAQKDFFADMGASQDEARDQIIDTLMTGQFYHQAVFRAFLAAPLQTRLAWIRGAFTWAKSYTRTKTFLDEYQARRQANAPDGGKAAGESWETARSRQEAEFKKQMAEMKKNLNQFPADARKELEESIREMEKQFKAQQENPEFQAMMKQGYQESARQEVEAQGQRQAEFEKNVPPQPRLLIARLLQRFLDLSASVDFSAPLELRQGRRCFVNPDYEAKPAEWKLIFRAGKETVEAVRLEVRTWLAEISR